MRNCKFLLNITKPLRLPRLKRRGLFWAHQSPLDFECRQESELKGFLRLGEPGEIDKANSSLKPQDLCLRLQILMVLKNMVLDSWRFLTSIKSHGL